MAEEVSLVTSNEIAKLSIKQLRSLETYIKNPITINIEKECILQSAQNINFHLCSSAAPKKLEKNIITHIRKRIKTIYYLIDEITKNKGEMEVLSLYAFLMIKNKRVFIDLKERNIKAIKNEIELTLLYKDEAYINGILHKNFYDPYLNKEPEFKYFANSIQYNSAHKYIGVKQITNLEVIKV